MKKTAWKGASSTEIAILIGISVVVVALGTMIFYNNIRNATLNTNMRQSFDGGSTANYTAENRDYANSQIEVQTMGAQGLEMMRRKANNMALELIESTNAETKANDIAYLAKALEIMTGETHICTKMTKDTDKHCLDFSSNYQYVTTLGSSLTITMGNIQNNAGRLGDSAKAEKKECNEDALSCTSKAVTSHETIPEPPAGPLTLKPNVINAIATTVYKDAKDYPTATNAEKIEAIIALTKAVYGDIDKNVALVDIDVKDLITSPTDDISSGTSSVITNAKDLTLFYLDKLNARMDFFYTQCEFNPVSGMPKDSACNNGKFNNSITSDEYNNFKVWYNELLNNVQKSNGTKEELAEILNNALANQNVVNTIEKDTLNRAIDDDETFTSKSASTVINDLIVNLFGKGSKSDGFATPGTLKVQESSVTANRVANSEFWSGCYDLYTDIIDFVSDKFKNIGSYFARTAGEAAQDFVQTADEIHEIWQSDEPTVDKIIDTTEKTNDLIVDVREIAHNSLSDAKDVVSDVYADKPVVKTIANAALTVVDVTVQAVTYVAQAAVKVVETGAKVVKAIGGFFKKLFGR